MDFSQISNEDLLKMRQQTTPSIAQPPIQEQPAAQPQSMSGNDLSKVSSEDLLKMRSPPSIANTPTPAATPKAEQMRPTDILDAKPQQQNQGLFGRIGEDILKRQQMGKDIVATKGQTGAETALQMAGKVGAGTVQDIGGELLKSTYGTLPESFKEKVSGGIQKAMSTPTGRFGIQLASKSMDKYKQWADQNPRVSRSLESLVDIASLAPLPSAKLAGQAISGATKAVGEVTAIRPILKGAMAPSAEEAVLIPDKLHRMATATIESAKDSGISYSPEHAQSLMETLGGLKQIQTAGERSMSSRTVDLIEEMKNSLLGPVAKNKKGKIIRDAGGEAIRDASKADTSFKNLYAFSQKLDEFSNEPAALNAKKAIRDALGDTSKVSVGNPQDVLKLEQFNSQWNMYKTAEDVVDATKLADTSAAKSRASFSKIANSPYFSTLSPEVKKLVITASEGKVSGKFLETVGSIKNLLGTRFGKHLPLIEAGGALLSGHPAVAAGIGTVMAAGKGGKLIQRGLGSDVLKYLENTK